MVVLKTKNTVLFRALHWIPTVRVLCLKLFHFFLSLFPLLVPFMVGTWEKPGWPPVLASLFFPEMSLMLSVYHVLFLPF